MSAHEPEDWPRVFEQQLNAGDLDAVMALYEPRASFVQRTGETIVGHDRIRQVLEGLIAARARFRSRVVKAITVGNIALLYTDFRGTTVDASGTTVEVRHDAIEVLRRQPDGTWRLIVGDPQRPRIVGRKGKRDGGYRGTSALRQRREAAQLRV